MAFLFIVFLCACICKEKRLWNLTRQRKEALYVRAGGYELPLCGNRLHLRYGVIRNVRTKHRRGAFHMPPLYGISFQQRGGALLSLPCVRGGAARRAAEGLYLTETIFLFCSANFRLLQSLRRYRASSLYWGEPFLVCANIAADPAGRHAPVALCASPLPGLCEHCGYVPCLP